MTFAFAMVACGKGDKNDKGAPPDSAAATAPAPSTASRSIAPPGAAPASAASFPGALTKPIDQYTGDELYAFAHGLDFTGGQERRRRCRGQPDCRGPNPGAFTRIRVDAVARQDSLNPGTVPTNGVIAMRALNRGTLTDSMYGMRAGPQYEHYLIALPGTGRTGTWRLEELVTTPGQRSHRSIMTGPFVGCNHPFVPGARADFKSCSQAALVRPASFSRTMQGDDNAPLWVSCLMGCCTSGPPT